MDNLDRVLAIVKARHKAEPGANPVALFARVLAEEADQVAAEAQEKGRLDLASKADGRSAEMDALADRLTKSPPGPPTGE